MVRIPRWLALGACLSAGGAQALDEDLYAQILERHTVAAQDMAGTRVDYRGLRDSADWQALLASLAASDPEALRSRQEELAFWINAYNILAMEMVRRHYPVDDIRSIGHLLSPVWKRPVAEIGSRARTLDHVEHEILRPMGDPRIHGAIVCAALSCPPLRREPYRAEQLNAQLDDNLRRWLADPRKGARLDRATGTLELSRIFRWFAQDFEGGVLPFVVRYLPEEDARFVRDREGSLRVRYLAYDWTLNDAAERQR